MKTFIKFLCRPDGDYSSKRLLAVIAVLIAGTLSFLHPENLPLVTSWLIFAELLLGLTAITNT